MKFTFEVINPCIYFIFRVEWEEIKTALDKKDCQVTIMGKNTIRVI